MQQNERLRLWMEQGNVSISQLFFKQYKQLGISDQAAMLLLQLFAFQSEGVSFPTLNDLASRMHATENEVSHLLQSLMQHGFLTIEQQEDEQSVLHEHFSLLPLWERLLDNVVMKEKEASLAETALEEGQIFTMFEQEFGRLLSPMECETISMWLDEDGHSVDLIRAALKEAVLAQKLSLRYIDRILFEWKKKKIKTIADVEKHSQSFRMAVGRSTTDQPSTAKKIDFYNWLEERE